MVYLKWNSIEENVLRVIYIFAESKIGNKKGL